MLGMDESASGCRLEGASSSHLGCLFETCWRCGNRCVRSALRDGDVRPQGRSERTRRSALSLWIWQKALAKVQLVVMWNWTMRFCFSTENRWLCVRLLTSQKQKDNLWRHTVSAPTTADHHSSWPKIVGVSVKDCDVRNHDQCSCFVAQGKSSGICYQHQDTAMRPEQQACATDPQCVKNTLV